MDPNRAALLLSAIALAIAIGSAITSERLGLPKDDLLRFHS